MKLSWQVRNSEACGNTLPMNNLKEEGIDRFSLAQNTPDFFVWYKPGSMIIGLALWNLKHTTRKYWANDTITTKTSRRKNQVYGLHAHSFQPMLLVCSMKFNSLGKYEKIWRRSVANRTVRAIASAKYEVVMKYWNN